MNKEILNINIARNYGAKSLRNIKIRNKTLTILNNLHFEIETNRFKMFLIGSKLIIKSFIKYALRFEKDPIADIVKHFVITLGVLMLLSISLVHFIK